MTAEWRALTYIFSRKTLHEKEVREERGGGDPHERAHLLEVAGHCGDDDVGDEAQADAIGDGIGERDADDDHEGRESLEDIGPIDLGDLAHHEEAHIHERAAGGGGADAADQRREERGEQEEHAGGHGGETGTATVGGARC